MIRWIVPRTDSVPGMKWYDMTNFLNDIYTLAIRSIIRTRTSDYWANLSHLLLKQRCIAQNHTICQSIWHDNPVHSKILEASTSNKLRCYHAAVLKIRRFQVMASTLFAGFLRRRRTTSLSWSHVFSRRLEKIAMAASASSAAMDLEKSAWPCQRHLRS